jgi:hypothetical protein
MIGTAMLVGWSTKSNAVTKLDLFLISYRGGTIVFEVGVQNYFASRVSEKNFLLCTPTVEILMFAFSQTANCVQNKFQT